MQLRIQVAVATPLPTPAARVSRRRLLAAIAAVAACVALAVTFYPRRQDSKGVGIPVDQLVVATADDVEILRIQEIDVGLLVVGESPLRKGLVLATLDDVEGLTVLRDTDGMMPMVAMSGPNAPMIVAPMATK